LRFVTGFKTRISMLSGIEPGPGWEPLLRVLRLQAEPSAEILNIPAQQAAALKDEARRQAILPLLGWLVQSGRIQLPQESAASLRQAFVQNTGRALAASALSARIAESLSQAGIQAIVLKGVALSQLLYGQPGVRQVGDIDLWIPQEQVLRADQVLRSAGYRRISPMAELSPSQWRLYCTLRHEFAYLEPQYGFRAELQWKLSNCGALSIGTHSEALAHSRTVVLPGATIPFLGDEDLVLHLCIHGGVEAWPKLKWLIDVAALFQRLDFESARSLAEKARQRGLERLLGVAARLSVELLNTPAGEGLPESLGSGSPAVRSPARTAAKTLIEQNFLPGGGGSLKETLDAFTYRLNLSPSLRYKAQVFATDSLVPERVLKPGLKYLPYPVLALLCLGLTQTTRISQRTIRHG
jgi:putative nucleotidyltransferase-like protein